MLTDALQLSSAVATPSSSSRVAVHDEVVTLTLAGTLMVGAMVSVPVTVIVCWQLAKLPLISSVAFQVMVVTPDG
jgi:hypothetical protein